VKKPRAKEPPPKPADESEPPEPPPKPKRVLVKGFIVLALMVVCTAGTLLYLNYGSGRVSDGGWTEFTAPDGSFAVELPGTPAEEEMEANPDGSVTGGKRYTVHGWYSKTTVWVSYCDLDPALVKKLKADHNGAFSKGIIDAEVERERERLKGKIINQTPLTRFMKGFGVELTMDTPRGKVVEWLVLVGEGPHPRVYAYGAEAKDLTPNSPSCRRLYGTFRVNE
jgi:hypothetical protein